MTGSVLTVAFLAVSVSIEDQRAARDARRSESFALRLLLAQEDELPGLNLSGADVERLYARNKRLPDATLSDGLFIDADFGGTDLRRAVLKRSNFLAANFTRANLEGANLRESVFHGADFSDARLVGADLTLADLTSADLRGADMTGAKFDLVTFNSQADGSSSMCYDATTVWPLDYEPPVPPDCSSPYYE